jgi:hypothetical protein
MTFTLRVAAPALPPHLRAKNGFLRARVTRRTCPAAPWADARPGDEALPWATLVHGLETDRAGMRARFERALREAVRAGEKAAALEARFGRPLGAAFRRIFGGRGETGHTPGFRTWALALTRTDEPRALRRIAAFGLLGWEDPRAE